MKKDILHDGGDPMGAAIYDFHKNGKAGVLKVYSSEFDDDEIPVRDLFRSFEQMPPLERLALELAERRILDVGAGSGCHSLALMDMDKSVKAIDISPLSVEVMKERGVDAEQVNFYNSSFSEKYDTVLMLMNGTGIIGNLENIPMFFSRLRELLSPSGSVLIDSSDLRYLFEEEDGSLMIDLADDYYGQLDYQMEYVGATDKRLEGVKGEVFDGSIWTLIHSPIMLRNAASRLNCWLKENIMIILPDFRLYNRSFCVSLQPNSANVWQVICRLKIYPRVMAPRFCSRRSGSI